MPCYNPLTGFFSKNLNSNGKRNIVFSQKEALDDRSLKLPCGQCIGCRLDHSRRWAMRIMHEASLYPQNCFLTLTYAQDKLPVDNSLHKPDFQKFMKRLRKANPSKTIRYYYCGEYGETFFRPHFHACIFNYDFNDKKPFKKINDNLIYRSARLEKLWTHGFASIGALTFDSAAYVARYVTKKVTGPSALVHYTDFDPSTGEIFHERLPEFADMSRRPGIGRPWLDKYMTDVYPDDFVVVRGRKLRPPKYYDNIHANLDPFGHDVIKERRELNGRLNSQNSTLERLTVREEVHLSKIKTLKRTLDYDS